MRKTRTQIPVYAGMTKPEEYKKGFSSRMTEKRTTGRGERGSRLGE